MSDKIVEVPKGLGPGWVLEWMPRGLNGSVTGLLKFYNEGGYGLDKQEITTNQLAELFDFYALAQNIACVKGLSVDCPKTFDLDKIPTMPVRCLFVNQGRVAQL